MDLAKYYEVAWIAYYDEHTGELSNADEVDKERNLVLNAGCVYLLKIKYRHSDNFVIEMGIPKEKDVLALADIFVNYHDAVWCAAFKMHSSNRFGDGKKYLDCLIPHYEGIKKKN